MCDTIIRNRLSHTYRTLENSIVHVNQGISLCHFCSRQQGGISYILSFFLPLLHQFLKYPKSGNILQKTDFSIRTAFIGKSCQTGFFRQNRFVAHHSQQRPGARTQESNFFSLSRKRHYTSRTGRIVRSYSNHFYLVVYSYLFLDFRFQKAAGSSRHNHFSEKVLRKSQLPNQLEIPGACLGIQQFRRRSYAILIISHSRKVIAEQVGHEKQLVGHLQLHIVFLLHGIQLK
ncbi:unknown [Phocaeicola plebeius CAG:211]|uniref:Uncharacterized protein n=1 Tax=Phocaeicola plebeius CAG:211 TaxID=1263052 RepID=R5W530_9BACT|nr:unknown [Phocaeicola plebeius CAG:211]